MGGPCPPGFVIPTRSLPNSSGIEAKAPLH
jgi:hypothetical protein